VVERLAAFVDAGPEHEFFKVFVPTVVRPGDTITVGDLTVAIGPATHPVPAVSFRVTGRGHSVVYTGDTGPCPELVPFAAGADLLMCEATFQGAPAVDRYPHHLYAAEAGALAVAAGVHALLVTHVAPSLDPEVSVAEAAAVFPGAVRHAEAGLEIGL
jgi:ribonuclease BN (tRNA processing enzyme)